MNKYKIVLLSGDGIGPEISQVSIKILKKLSKKYDFDIELKKEYFGGIAYEKYKDPAPKVTLDHCKESDAVLLACVGDVKYDSLPRELRPESGLLKLRSELNLFANIRPVKIRKALLDSSSLKKEIVENVDLIVVRELIGGIYFGQPRGQINNTEFNKAFNTMIYDSFEIKRITEVAIKIANQRNKKICSVDKSNVLEVSQLWRDTVLEVTSKDKDLNISNMYVDNAAMQLVKDPSQFDVI